MSHYNQQPVFYTVNLIKMITDTHLHHFDFVYGASCDRCLQAIGHYPQITIKRPLGANKSAKPMNLSASDIKAHFYFASIFLKWFCLALAPKTSLRFSLLQKTSKPAE